LSELLARELRKANVALIQNPKALSRTPGNIAQVFLNVDLRNSYDGLLTLAEKELRKQNRKLNLHEFPRGNYLVFINERGNRFKLLTPARHTKDGLVIDWIVAFYKNPTGHRIDANVIYEIPLIFSGRHTLELEEKAQMVLEDRLRYRRNRVLNP
jgi:hypothetical protein